MAAAENDVGPNSKVAGCKTNTMKVVMKFWHSSKSQCQLYILSFLFLYFGNTPHREGKKKIMLIVHVLTPCIARSHIYALC